MKVKSTKQSFVREDSARPKETTSVAGIKHLLRSREKLRRVGSCFRLWLKLLKYCVLILLNLTNPARKGCYCN